MEESGVLALSSESDLCKISLSSQGRIDVTQIVSTLLSAGDSARLLRISENPLQKVEFYCQQKSLSELKKLKGVSVEHSNNLGVIYLVGHGFKDDPQLLKQVFDHFISQPINIEISEQKITALFDQSSVTENIQRLHQLVDKN